MQEKIVDQILLILRVFNDPNEMIPLMENYDIEGKDIITYFQEFKLF